VVIPYLQASTANGRAFLFLFGQRSPPRGKVADIMDGVITAIIAFIFVCIIFPSLVKNRHQFYGALLLVLIAFLFDNIARVTSSQNRFRDFAAIMDTFLVIGAVLLLILCAGGLAVRDLAADIGKTIEVVRRGGEKETIIVPRTGEMPKVRETPEPERERISLDDE